MSAHSGLLSAQFPDVLNATDRLRPTKPLPTDRISPQNQLRILRAWAAASNEGTRPATVNEVASTVEMASSTVAMTNPFFSSIGLLQRLAVGTYIPTSPVIAYFNASNPDTAARKLASVFRDAWFGQLIVPKLKYAPMDEAVALSVLEDASGVGEEQRKALGIIVDFMIAVGLIERSGSQIKLTSWYSEPSQLIPAISSDGSGYCVTVRVDSKALADALVNLLNTLAGAIAGTK